MITSKSEIILRLSKKCALIFAKDQKIVHRVEIAWGIHK